jgi:sec-independent protein translocase protein TatA
MQMYVFTFFPEPTILLGFIGMPSGMEWIILLVLGLLIFGRRLPEVGRSLGRGIVEFKKGIRGLEDDIETESTRTPAKREPERRQELPKAADQNQKVRSEVDDANSYVTVENRRQES